MTELLIDNRYTQENFVRVALPFEEGRFFNTPIPQGFPGCSQTDVKCKWPDGSIKHAIFSLDITSKGIHEIGFATDPPPPSSAGPINPKLKVKQHNLDAKIIINGGEALSAREKILAGEYTTWCKGPVATSVILSQNDYWMYITFTKNNMYVRYCVENVDTERLTDKIYNVVLLIQMGSSQRTWTKNDVYHYAGTRWTKSSSLAHHHDYPRVKVSLEHLAKTKAIPNYDHTRKLNYGEVDKLYQKFLNRPKDILDDGLWMRAMGTGGGRPDIGPFPAWTVYWLHDTGNPYMRKMAMKQADLSGGWPIHLREGREGANWVGAPITVLDRPTLMLWQPDTEGFEYHYTNEKDRIKPIGFIKHKADGWVADGAHQPDPCYPQYLLTGDPWYLEQMHFWASWSAARYNWGCHYGRGPDGMQGAIHDEIRGDGWVFRNRCQAAFITPDNDSYKKYLERLIDDCIAAWEGVRDIYSEGCEDKPMWKWGYSNQALEFGEKIPPLHHWRNGSIGWCQKPVDVTKTKRGLSPWEEWMLIYSLGRAKELGYPTEGLLLWAGEHLIGMLHTMPEYTAAYRIPVKNTADNYFPSFKDMMEGFVKDYNMKAKFKSYLFDPCHGYSYIMACALSYCKDLPGGESVWNRINKVVMQNEELNKNPKWAIFPREK